MPHAVVIAALILGAGQAAPKVAMPGLSALGLEDRYAVFFGEHLAQQLKFEGLDVVTNKEIASLLGLERQKQLLGCSEASSSCMAELASALGADGVLLGDLAKVGGRTQLNLKVISARDGRTFAAFSDRVEGDEAVLDALSRAAVQLAKGVATALGRTLTPVAAELRGSSTPPAARFWWVPVAGGALVAGVGAFLFNSGGGDYDRLKTATADHPLSLKEAQALRDGGSAKQQAGVICAGAGLAAVFAGGLWLALAKANAPASVAWVPTATGGAVIMTGELP